MFAVWIGRLLFGATICLGVLDHSSNAISPEQSRAEEMIKVLRQTLGLKVGLPVPKKRSRKVPQFMLDLHDKEVNDPEWISRFLKTTGKQTTSNIIRAIRNEGVRIVGQYKKGNIETYYLSRHSQRKYLVRAK